MQTFLDVQDIILSKEDKGTEEEGEEAALRK